MKALYRRYRPKTLSEVVGQEQITSVLQHSLESGKFSHAYLFVGPRGCGKTSVARILAHEINHFNYELEDDYIDIIEIDGASNRGIDNIRELRERAAIAPTKGKYKVYIIDEVHMLTKEAFNALLKTLEEPPEHVVFIMATTDVQKVPITIISRSQVYTFRLADPSTMFTHLKSICASEKIAIEDEALKIVVRRGGGSFRDSLSLLDQVSTLSDDKITADLLNRTFGLPQEAIINDILSAYDANDTDSIRKQLTTLAETGVKSEVIASELIDAIIATPNANRLPLLDKLTKISPTDTLSVKSAKLLVALCNNTPQIPTFPRQSIPQPQATLAAQPVKQQVKPSSTVAKTPPTPEAPEKTEEPAPPKPAALPNDAGAEQIWQAIIATVAEKSPMLTSDIVSSKYTLNNNLLKIYTGNYLKAKNLEKRRNIITAVIPETISVEISKETLTEDPEVANIAAIMGGGEEIQIDA